MDFISRQHLQMNLRPFELPAVAVHGVMKKMTARWRCWRHRTQGKWTSYFAL
jgi:hypothetical protein